MKDFKAFIEDVEKDKEFGKKFKEELKAIAEAGKVKSDGEAVIEAAKAFGYDIKMSDLEKRTAEMQKMDDSELAAVSSGEGGKYDDFCVSDYTCYVTWKHPDDSEDGDKCWSEYGCFFAAYHDTKSCVFSYY